MSPNAPEPIFSSTTYLLAIRTARGTLNGLEERAGVLAGGTALFILTWIVTSVVVLDPVQFDFAFNVNHAPPMPH